MIKNLFTSKKKPKSKYKANPKPNNKLRKDNTQEANSPNHMSLESGYRNPYKMFNSYKSSNPLSVSLTMPDSHLSHAIREDSFQLKDKLFNTLGISRHRLLKTQYSKMLRKNKRMKSSDFWAEKYRDKIWKRTELEKDFMAIRKEKVHYIKKIFLRNIERFQDETNQHMVKLNLK